MMMETDKMDEMDNDPDDGARQCLYVTFTFHISATLFDLLILLQTSETIAIYILFALHCKPTASQERKIYTNTE